MWVAVVILLSVCTMPSKFNTSFSSLFNSVITRCYFSLAVFAIIFSLSCIPTRRRWNLKAKRWLQKLCYRKSELSLCFLLPHSSLTLFFLFVIWTRASVAFCAVRQEEKASNNLITVGVGSSLSLKTCCANIELRAMGETWWEEAHFRMTMKAISSEIEGNNEMLEGDFKFSNTSRSMKVGLIWNAGVGQD